MRKQWFGLVVVALLGAVLAAPAWAQMATVKGTVIGMDGNPLQNAKVEFANKDNGQKYSLKTNKKGEYFSIGVTSGSYKLTVFGPDGKQLTFYDNVRVTLQLPENVFDFNLKQMQDQQEAGVVPAAPGQAPAKLTPEQQKALEEHRKQEEAVAKENTVVKNLNQMLASSKAAAEAGNFDVAISTMQQAVQADSTRDVLWAVLGDYELRAARKPGTDAPTKTKLSTDATEAYTKAIAACQVEKPAPSCKDVASYHNNLGQALSNTGKTAEAIAEYEKAAQLNPAGAGQYYFNEGAILTNTGKTDEANAAFDKAIAAEPTKADAYYQKGVNMMAKATLDKDGKIVAPAGAKESIEKDLELAPTGSYAESAKELLTAMGQTIQTSYGTKGKKKQ